MPDTWILAFVSHGLIAAAGDTMPISECEWRARDLDPQRSQVVCINTKDPSCRIYRDPSRDMREWQQELEQRCRRRNKPQKEEE